MNVDISEEYLTDVKTSFTNYKKLAERALDQVSDEEFFRQIDEESNSLAVIVKHLTGNLKSRWTDFLTTDGEKEFRDRDAEFLSKNDNRKDLLNEWEAGWQILFKELSALNAADLAKTVTIRQQKQLAIEAINRQLTHYAYHIGQITFLAKHFRATDWQTLSVPKNKSNQFNKFMTENKDDERKQVELAQEFSRQERK